MEANWGIFTDPGRDRQEKDAVRGGEDIGETAKDLSAAFVQCFPEKGGRKEKSTY